MNTNRIRNKHITDSVVSTKKHKLKKKDSLKLEVKKTEKRNLIGVIKVKYLSIFI